jgi:hypothetical protein
LRESTNRFMNSCLKSKSNIIEGCSFDLVNSSDHWSPTEVCGLILHCPNLLLPWTKFKSYLNLTIVLGKIEVLAPSIFVQNLCDMQTCAISPLCDALTKNFLLNWDMVLIETWTGSRLGYCQVHLRPCFKVSLVILLD